MKLERLRRRAARKQRKRARARARRMERVLDWLGDAPPAAARGWEASIYGFSVPLSAQAHARLRAAPGAKRITVAITVPASGAASKP